MGRNADPLNRKCLVPLLVVGLYVSDPWANAYLRMIKDLIILICTSMIAELHMEFEILRGHFLL